MKQWQAEAGRECFLLSKTINLKALLSTAKQKYHQSLKIKAGKDKCNA
ncbi:hypothetical protein [Bartonella sp. AA78NXGY]